MDIKTREERFLKLKPKLELPELDIYLFLPIKMIKESDLWLKKEWNP